MKKNGHIGQTGQTKCIEHAEKTVQTGQSEQTVQGKTDTQLCSVPLEDGLRELYKVIASMDNAVFVASFFECLFTPAERSDLAKRWLLVREIDKGTTQRDIARMFKMSLCKITRGAKELKKENSAFRKVLDSLSDFNVMSK